MWAYPKILACSSPHLFIWCFGGWAAGLDEGCRLWSAVHFSDGSRQVYLLLDDHPLSEPWNNEKDRLNIDYLAHASFKNRSDLIDVPDEAFVGIDQ